MAELIFDNESKTYKIFKAHEKGQILKNYLEKAATPLLEQYKKEDNEEKLSKLKAELSLLNDAHEDLINFYAIQQCNQVPIYARVYDALDFETESAIIEALPLYRLPAQGETIVIHYAGGKAPENKEVWAEYMVERVTHWHCPSDGGLVSDVMVFVKPMKTKEDYTNMRKKNLEEQIRQFGPYYEDYLLINQFEIFLNERLPEDIKLENNEQILIAAREYIKTIEDKLTELLPKEETP